VFILWGIKMKYYLVALFDVESYGAMEKIQKSICQKYKLSKNVPMLHITLETVEDPDIDKLSRVITDILKPYKKFKVETNGIISFDPPYKSVNLKVENKGYIIRLARTINDTLKLHGFNVKEHVDNWDLHIPLASANYTSKEWSSRDYVAASSETKKDGFYRMSRVDRIELWKSVNNRKETLIKSFPLRDF
jgi:2'-5' RNA ligase